MKTKSIQQSIEFAATPLEIYHMLMDAEKHAAFTSSDVTMSKEIKGEFSVFDGYCHGYNIELIEGEKIVQAWHFAEDGWPDDHYSICTFTLEKIATGTKLNFLQTDVPEHKVKDLTEGWNDFYWEQMKFYVAKHAK